MDIDSDSPRVVFLGDGLVAIGFRKDEPLQQVGIVFDLLETPASVGERLDPARAKDGEQRLVLVVAKNTAALDVLAEVVRRAREEMAAMEEGRD